MLKMLLAKKGKFMYNDMETMIDTFIIKRSDRICQMIQSG